MYMLQMVLLVVIALPIMVVNLYTEQNPHNLLGLSSEQVLFQGGIEQLVIVI